ncbi:MAG TPA: serine/threonine-protein kinase [Polyangia bacterium]|nr:serine/threonine-protein kinase [Polyangia bacterium]
MGTDSRTAKLAVAAAALALGGLVLAAAARLWASGAVDGGNGEALVQANRLGEILSAAAATARVRAEGLAAMPTVRGAVETDVATVRDMTRAQGFVFAPAPHEVLEIVQLSSRHPPLSLYRAPETAASLGITQAHELRVDEAGGALVVTVAAPSQPLYQHAGLEGAVAVATRVDLAPLVASLQSSGMAAELLGAGDPVALTVQRSGEGGTRVKTVPVPFTVTDGKAPSLSLRVSPRARAGGGALLLAGRALLVVAFLMALLTFVSYLRRVIPALDDAPTAPVSTSVAANGPAANAPERRGDGDHLVLAWSASMPTPITQLRPALESLPIVIDPRGDELAGRYRLLQPLGRGHSSEVYLAQSFVAGATGAVALKVLSGRDCDERRTFLEAARAQMRLTHPHVARVLDVGDGDHAYVAMEYVEGCTLEALLGDLFRRDEPLPLPQTIAIVGAMCRALEAARPLVHGAVKPSNVLVGRHNVVKLADFGAPPSATDRHAPEQYAGQPADRRGDVYAVGVVLHELLTGRRMQVTGGDPKRWPALPAPSTVRPMLPRELDGVVAKATRFAARGRYGSANELLAALHDAAAGAAEMATEAWLGDWVERARRSS